MNAGIKLHFSIKHVSLCKLLVTFFTLETFGANTPARKYHFQHSVMKHASKVEQLMIFNFFFSSPLQIENLQDQLRDKEKQLSGLKDRVKSLQTDTSNTDTALGTLEEALAEKVHRHTHTDAPTRILERPPLVSLGSAPEQGYINKSFMSKTTDHPDVDPVTRKKWK